MSATTEEQAVIDAAHDNVVACSQEREAARRIRNANDCDEVTVDVLRIEEAEARAQMFRTHCRMREAVHTLLRKRSKDAVAEVEALRDAVASHKDGEV